MSKTYGAGTRKELPSSVYGDGNNGAVDLDGVNTYPGFSSKTGSNYTLSNHVFATTLIVRSGCKLYPDGWIVHASESLEVEGEIIFDGEDGTESGSGSGTGGEGAGDSDRPLGRGGDGGDSDNNGESLSECCGGQGGNGGTGDGIQGLGGVVTAPDNPSGGAQVFKLLASAMVARTLSGDRINGGTGGGGGASEAGIGGRNCGGGGGGGVIVLLSKILFGTGSVHANGGAGATSISSGCGAGGGGGGGVVLSVSDETPTVSRYANGGAAGAGNGNAGNAGNNGTVHAFTVAE